MWCEQYTFMLLDAKILATLQKLGLTYYGAKVYVTLVAIGATTATVLSTESEVPRTRIYDVLRRLEEKKWITVEKGRPCTYSPRYPKKVVEERSAILLSELGHCSNELTLMYNRKVGTETYKVSLTRGVDNISAKVTEMIGRSRQSIIMLVGTLPFSPAETERLEKEIIKLKKKGVTVQIVATPEIYLKNERIDIREAFPFLMIDIRLFPHLPDREARTTGMSLYIDRKETLTMFQRVESGVPDLEGAIAIWVPAKIAQYTINRSDFDGYWEDAVLPESKSGEDTSGRSARRYKHTFTEEVLRKEGLKERQIKAVMWVKERGSITNSKYCRITGLSHDGAFRDLRGLVEKGILKVDGKGRSVRYELAQI